MTGRRRPICVSRSTAACSVEVASVARSQPCSAARRRATTSAPGGARSTAGTPVVSACHGGNDALGWSSPRYSDEVKSSTPGHRSARDGPRLLLLADRSLEGPFALFEHEPAARDPPASVRRLLARDLPALLHEPPLQVERRLHVAIRTELRLAAVLHVRGQVHARDGVVRVDVPLDLLAPVAGPVAGLLAVEHHAPVAEADAQENLLPEDAEIVEVADGDVAPALGALHRVDPVHPRLRVGDHDPARQ